MARIRPRVYVHSPTPPFYRIGGPIYPSGLSHRQGLSDPSTARFQVSGNDVEEDWLQPGMCWLVDNSDLGEDPWAGFILEQQLPLNADTLSINLAGPKEALLNIEQAVRLPINSTRAFAVRQSLESALTRHGGISPGIIDASEGPAIPLDVRGETVSDFINTLHNESGGSEWKERVELVGGGEELQFFLDFGKLQFPTSIVIGRKDLVDGLFTRERIPVSMSLVGESYGFEARPVSNTSINLSTGAPEPAQETITLTDFLDESLAARSIGPAATYHKTVISERVKADLIDYVRQRHTEILQALDEFLLTVDMTRTNAQRIRIGDVIGLDVSDWSKPLNRSIKSKLHVVRSEVNGETGQRILQCRVVGFIPVSDPSS